MLEPGTPIEMTKGYKGVKGVVLERTESDFEFYVLKLDSGINLVAGPQPLSLRKGKRTQNLIRKKIGINNKKANLRSHLLSLL